jgi:hypothetical protein
MGKTAFTGPILGNADSGGGLWKDAPIELVNRFTNQWYFNDFASLGDFDYANNLDWDVTAIGVVTATPDITLTDGLTLLDIEGDASAEGHVVQLEGESWQPAADRVIQFEALVGQTDGDDMDFFVGVGETLDTFMETGGTIAAGAVGYAGFHLLGSDNDGIVDCIAEGGSGAATNFGVANTVALADSTITGGLMTNFHRYGVRITGTTQVEFFFDGRYVQGGSVAAAFDDALTITICGVSGAANDSLYVDYVAINQTRLP